MLPNYRARSPFVLKHITSYRASEASEILLGVVNAKLGICYWRVSGASETVLRVDNAKSVICSMYIIYIIYVLIVRMPLKCACGYRFFS